MATQTTNTINFFWIFFFFFQDLKTKNGKRKQWLHFYVTKHFYYFFLLMNFGLIVLRLLICGMVVFKTKVEVAISLLLMLLTYGRTVVLSKSGIR